MPTLARISIFPIKSLDRVDVESAVVLPSGALSGDRRYALLDSWGRNVNGKRCPAIHQIRTTYSDDLLHVTLSDGKQAATFSLVDQHEAIAQWCGEVLGTKCRLVENAEYGFPDDTEAPGPTAISTGSLTEAATWFDGVDLEESRRRFRTNLEIDIDIPFWEDRLVTDRHKIRRFCVGDVVLQGRGVCERCVVPTRDSQNGAVMPGFGTQFRERREALLPEWSPRERFDHFYRLGINTALDSLEKGNVIHVGDSVE